MKCIVLWVTSLNLALTVEIDQLLGELSIYIEYSTHMSARLDARLQNGASLAIELIAQY